MALALRPSGRDLLSVDRKVGAELAELVSQVGRGGGR